MKEMVLEKKIPSFKGITCDSRQVKPGYAFVAISGFKNDGNIYIKEAIAKGASVVFTEKYYQTEADIPIIQVKDTRFLLGQLAAKYYNYPAQQLKVVGVTGTNGKTTTTHLIYQLLNFKKKTSGLIGTVQVDTGKKINKGGLTTPQGDLLQKQLQEMLNNNLKYACIEVSSHGIKLKRIAGTQFTVKVGTNLSPDHFDLHPDFQEYINVKKSFLSNNKEETLVLINHDNHYLKSWGKLNSNQLNYGIENKTEIMATNISKQEMETNFIYQLNRPLIKDNGQIINPCQIPFQIKIPGKHNIYNSLVTITIGLYYGLKIPEIQSFFKHFTGVWRRFEIIYKQEFTIIDDCAHNPGSYQAVFQAINDLDFNQLIIVNSLRGNRGKEINQRNAATISKHLQNYSNYHLFTTNVNDFVKTDDLVSNNEEKAFLDTLNKNRTKYLHFQKLLPALKLALSKLKAGDLLLLLGPHAMDKTGEITLNLLNTSLK